MNSEEQKAWKNTSVTLIVPNTKFEYRMNRHRLPATHIAHPTDEARTLCGKSTDDWNCYDCPTKIFNLENWHPSDCEVEGSKQLCQSCVKKFRSLIKNTSY